MRCLHYRHFLKSELLFLFDKENWLSKQKIALLFSCDATHKENALTRIPSTPPPPPKKRKKRKTQNKIKPNQNKTKQNKKKRWNLSHKKGCSRLFVRYEKFHTTRTTTKTTTTTTTHILLYYTENNSTDSADPQVAKVF